MSGQVDKLHNLLTRVQENRTQPRAQAVAPAPAAVEPEPPAAQRATRASSPLEMAVAGELDRAQPAPAPAPPAAAPAPPAAAPAPPAAAPAPAPAPAPASPEGGIVLADPNPVEPARSVAQVVSKSPVGTDLSFGELLRRSLSLRPR